ncbi:MAG: hypothetical protein DCC55_13590 [Chloroflexi bacterium]|nr:MAG: hypothetical protein DCC55_13590 [Chloroflexota bacterium]
MAATLDTFVLEDIVTLNRVDTRGFLPFTIYRLKPLATDRRVILTVTLQNVSAAPLEIRQLQLSWASESDRPNIPPVQEHVVTEWAACGIACALIPLYTGLQVIQVTQVGDRFDYWVGNESQEFGLEVSGLLTGELEQRQRIKLRQLSESPHKVAGYISITSFHAQRTILSFHQM